MFAKTIPNRTKSSTNRVCRRSRCRMAMTMPGCLTGSPGRQGFRVTPISYCAPTSRSNNCWLCQLMAQSVGVGAGGLWSTVCPAESPSLRSVQSRRVPLTTDSEHNRLGGMPSAAPARRKGLRCWPGFYEPEGGGRIFKMPCGSDAGA
jgi:hypothetical protein